MGAVGTPRLLNIGSGPASLTIPAYYEDWDAVRLDIEPRNEPDLLMDAMDLDTLEASQFDAAYASHLLEHIYPQGLERFMRGVHHVLVADGFVDFRVPDALAACRRATEDGTLDAPCYTVAVGTVTAWDMLYGYLHYQQVMGPAMAHHNGFSQQTLTGTLQAFGFGRVYIARNEWEMGAIGCKTDLDDDMKERIGLDRATGEHRLVHSDDGAANVEPVRQLRPVAELPLRDPSRRSGNGHSPAALAAGGRGTHLPRAAGLGGRL